MKRFVAMARREGVVFPIIMEIDGNGTRYSLDFLEFCALNEM